MWYESNRIVFGLTNAPSAFQYSMEANLRDKTCNPYLDDVLRICSQASKLRPDKWDRFRNEVLYLGKVISADGCMMHDING